MIKRLLDWHLGYILLVLVLFIISFYVHPIFVHVPLLIAIIPIAKEAVEKLIKNHEIGTEFFLTIATAVALIGHEERAITIVLIIMLIAEYLESIIEERTQREIESLITLIPTEVTLVSDGAEKIVSLSEIKPGMFVRIQEGGRIPVDGLIMQGEALVNEAALTGESAPKEKNLHDAVYAGTFVESGSILVQTKRVGAATFFGKISDLVRVAEEGKARITRLADKIAFWLVPILLTFIFTVWIITQNTRLVVTLLVFGSPLELTLVTPLAILAGVIAAFRRGILVKGGIALERLSQIDTIIFDKTGTLTIGEPTVVQIDVLDSRYTEKDIIKLAAIAEKRSGHVLAKALLKRAAQENIEVPDPDKYISVAGHGVEIMHNNKRFLVGNKHYIEAPEHGNIKIPESGSCSVMQEYYSTFYLACTDHVCARICTADIIRQNAREVISELKNSGLTVMLVSGDRQEVVNHTAQLLGIETAQGEIFPDKKLLIIRDLETAQHRVAMVGDGINDAPALKQAYVGIALGAMGMEPAIEAADIVLMSNDLEKISFVYKLSKKVLRVIKQNIFFGFILVHSLGMLLAFLGYLSPVQAALFHAIPDLSMILNSARLINFKG